MHMMARRDSLLGDVLLLSCEYSLPPSLPLPFPSCYLPTLPLTVTFPMYIFPLHTSILPLTLTPLHTLHPSLLLIILHSLPPSLIITD